MPTGIRAEVRIERPETCEVAPVSETREVGEVVRSSTAAGTTVEFTVEEPVAGEALDADPVFRSGARTVFRLSTDHESACVCEYVERLGCPVRDHTVVDGTVTVAFLVADVENLQRVIRDLKATFEGVGIRRLTRSECVEGDRDLVYVDRSALTARQRDVLCSAHRMGYFAHPRRTNARDVAESLDIAPATFREHLAAAQRKLMDAVLERD